MSKHITEQEEEDLRAWAELPPQLVEAVIQVQTLLRKFIADRDVRLAQAAETIRRLSTQVCTECRCRMHEEEVR